MVSDEAPQGADGQVVCEDHHTVLEAAGQVGRPHQQHTTDARTSTHTHTGTLMSVIFRLVN